MQLVGYEGPRSCALDALERVSVLHIPEAGRGRALTQAWLASDADVLSYMDIDLSTDLDAFPKLISAITDQGYDVAAGSRLDSASDTTRSTRGGGV